MLSRMIRRLAMGLLLLSAAGLAQAGCVKEVNELTGVIEWYCSAPTVSITSPVDGSNAANPVQVTVTASDGYSTKEMITEIALYVDGAYHASQNYSGVKSATAVFTLGTLGKGSHQLLAKVYDEARRTSDSNAVGITIGATSTTLASTDTTPAVAQSVTLTASVSGASPGGTVTFKEGTTTLGAATLTTGQASLAVSFATAGTHSVTASYGGDANNLASTSTALAHTVAKRSTTTTTASTDTTPAVAQSVTLTATVAGTNPSGTVTFKEGTTTLGSGTVAAGKATLAVSFATAGTHSVTADYGGDANNLASTSAALAHTVAKRSTTTTTASTDTTPAVAQSVTLTATVAGTNPSGTVTFKEGTTTLGSGTVSAGKATLAVSFDTAGTHSVTASYGGDANNLASTSAALAHTVDKRSSATTVSASPSSPQVGRTTTLTATVSGTSPSGSVTFKDGSTTLGNSTLSAGKASLQAVLFSAGTHAITATYAGDANHQSSTSGALNVGVTELQSVSVTVPHLANGDAGTLPGQAAVQAGRAAYSIPLAMPPGVAGMVPGVTLDYQSAGANGVAGMGWSLGGLSTIHRCPPTIEQDGRIDALRLNNADRVCLDGKRLVLAKPANAGTLGDAAFDTNYWSASAEYRTETETFTRIVRSGSGFKAYTRDGRIHAYGGSTSTERKGLTGGSAVVHTWALRRVEDRSGNAISYAYTLDAATGEHRLASIRWGENLAAGQSHFAKAVFAYETRPDADIAFVAGGRADQTKRLAKVSTWTDTAADGTGGTQVLEYRLAYTASATSGRSLLASVQACIPAGACLPATSFEWGAKDTSINPAFASLGQWAGPVLEDRIGDTQSIDDGRLGHMPGEMYVAADFTGDGLNDLITRYPLPLKSQGIKLYRNTGSGFLASDALPGLPLDRVVAETGDFDGDGQTDLLVAQGTQDSWGFVRTSRNSLADWRICWSRHRQGQGFQCQAWAEANQDKTNLRLVYDFNGDGRDDIYFSGYSKLVGNAGTQRMCLANGTGFVCSVIDSAHTIALAPGVGDAHTWPSFHDADSTDLDGDGRLDILRPGRPVYDSEITEWIFDNRAVYAMQYDESGGCGVGCEGVGIFNYGTPPEYNTSWTGGHAGDLNGDGYSDMVFRFGPTPTATHEFRRCLSPGLGGLSCEALPLHFLTEVGHIADFDADGSPEVLLKDAAGYKSCTVRAGGAVNCTTTWASPPLPYQATPQNAYEGNRDFWIDFTGDGVPEHVYYRVGGQWEILQATSLAKSGQALDRLVSVTNGVGHQARFDYAPPGDAATYNPQAAAPDGTAIEPSYPAKRMPRMDVLVRTLEMANGQGGWLQTRHTYAGATRHQRGRGQLGFARIDASDVQRGLSSTAWYSQQWPHIGSASATRQTVDASGVVLAEASSELASRALSLPSGQTSRFTYTDSNSQTRRDLDGSALATTATEWTYGDDWGNATQVKQTTTGGSKSYVSTTDSVYQNDEASWLIGLPTHAAVTKTRDGTSATRSTDTAYTAQGLLQSQTIEKGDSAYELTTSYERVNNSWGLVNKTTQTWRDPASNSSASRVVQEVLAFEAKGRYASQSKNALGHASSQTLDPATGVRTALTDPNGQTTSWSVNSFGRVTAEQRPDGTQSLHDAKQCDANCPANATHAHIERQLKNAALYAAPSVTYLDAAGHGLATKTWGLDGRAMVAEQRHDSLGRLEETDHARYEADEAQLASRRGYDALDRVVSLATPDETGALRATTTGYQGLSVTVTNALSHAVTTERDALGQVAKVTDAAGSTTYAREPFDALALVTDAQGNQVTITHDRLGRRTDLRDPDLGWIHEDVDPPGRVWRRQGPRQRAAGSWTTQKHDALDRLTERVDADLQSHWVWDTAPNGIGQLAEAYTGPSNAKDYRREHAYDSLSRPISAKLTLDASYTSTTSYDAWGRVDTITHQRGSEAAKSYRHVYGSLGDLIRVERGSQVLWRLLEHDASRRATVQGLGNGLVQRHGWDAQSARLASSTLEVANTGAKLTQAYGWDSLGRLDQRTRWWDGAGSTEDFDYDALDRLTGAQVQGEAKLSQTYDAIGNLKTRTGLGTYTYPAAQAARPHAVQSTALGAYGYDIDGNLTSAPSGTTISWTAFGQPDKITRSSQWSQFGYGAEQQRARQTRSDGTAVYYAGAMQVEVKSGQATVKTYWPQGLGLEVDKPGQATELLWTHTDHQGSVLGLSTATGAWKEKLDYDAWGKRRTTDGASTPDTLDGQADDKGYTGHEMLDQLDLVHMNGRVYDPKIARFLSADPIIQDPEHGQSYNRYSYVWNSPTNLTDPTGMVVETDKGKEDTKPLPSNGNGIGRRSLDLGWGVLYQSPQDNGASQPSEGGARSEGADGKAASREGGRAAKGVAAGDVASNLWNSGDNWIGLGRNVATAVGTTAWNLANFLGAGVAGDSQWAADSADALLNKDAGATVATAMVAVGRIAGARAPAEMEAGSIRNVNAVGGRMNCVNCVVATDATLAGRPASALPGGPYRIDTLEKFYGTRFSAPGPISKATEALSAAGPGARGIVFGSRGSEVGHVFNGVNQNGVVRFLDGQTGKAASLDGFKSFQLLRTN